MRKLTRIIIAIVLLFTLLFISSGYFLKQECHGSQCLPPEIKAVYDIVKDCGLEYQAEPYGEDYWKAPYETERDGGGDCEDLSLWLLYKLTKLEYDVWVVMGVDRELGHMWVRVNIVGDFPRLWDIDMVAKTINSTWEEAPFNAIEIQKFENVIERQRKYEEGE